MAARPIDPEAIRRDTIAYYDRRPVLGDAWEAEPAGDFPDPTAERELLERTLCGVAAGQRVLELGCGTGAATRLVAPVATSVVAIDSSATCIRLAGEQSSSSNVEFRVGDAFELHVGGGFSAGFALGLFHLIPAVQHDAFLDRFHRTLLPGSRVFLSASHARTLRAKKRLFQVEGLPDLFCARTLTDGSTYHVINNAFDEPTLRSIFEPRTKHLQLHVGDAWWWVTYVV